MVLGRAKLPKFVALLLAVTAAAFNGPTAHANESDFSGTVTRVIDGDTLRLSGHQPRIRLFGIDAPERGKLGYETATLALRRITDSQRLRCERINTGRYGRTVDRCWNESGSELSAEMIRLNAATEWCRYSGGIYETCGNRGLET